MDKRPFATDIPPASHEAWMAAVARVLKGAPFDRVLVGRSYDGIAIQPLYPKAEGASPLPGRPARPWRIAARLDHPGPAEANGLILADLAGGADAVTIVCAEAPGARGFGLSAPDLETLDRALGGVMLDLVAIRIEAGPAGRGAAALAVALADMRGHPLGDVDLDLGLDPIGAAAASGRLSAPWPAVGARLAQTLGALAERGFAGRLALADGRPYHEAGASDAGELAAVLSTALAYLRALEAGGHALETARRALSFLLVADADAFLTIAKFRALRRLWARIEAASGLDPEPIRLHAETAYRMTTRRDPWVNLLRGTLAGFGAGIGGADSVSILPFTSALGLPDAFARRLARNTQHVLIEEASLARIADPAAGSGAFEALTDELVAAAWTRFAEIEREGGITQSLAAGALQARIAATAERRRTAIATRRDPLTGTSEFADLHERPVAVLMPAATGEPSKVQAEARPAASPRPGATFADLVDLSARGASLAALSPAHASGAPSAVPLPSRRLAEPFERLRDLADAALARTGTRPRMFLAPLGPLTAVAARATFTRNALAACGIEAPANDGFATLAEMVEDFRRNGAEAACLCSSDEIYADQGVAAAEALLAAGARRLYLAGRPTDALRAAGITGFLHAGCDLPAVLEGEVGSG